MIVAIDGPAGAGKSTVARGLAQRLGVGHLDTGAMYRALTWLAIRDGIDAGDGPALAALAAAHPAVLRAGEDGDPGRVLIAGADVTEAIRHPEVTAAVSEVSAHRGVRVAVVAAQRALLAAGDWVSDGRDVGSAVCPQAEVKVYLTASAEERARRRREELRGRDVLLSVEEVLADVRRRDHLDSTRAASPLRVPEGAVVIDSSGLSAAEVIERIARLAGERAGGAVARPTGDE